MGLGAATAHADTGYGEYVAWADWARRTPGVLAGLASSYDRSGGNDDYSHYEWPEGLIEDEIICTAKTIDGPGIIYRFWMPHLTANQVFVVRMYFDNEPTPRIDTTSDVIFAESFSYFTAPFVDTCAGGQVCYEPIPFAESLRIETVNHELPPDGWSPHRHYYQYTYKTFPPGAAITSYTGELSPEEQAARDAAANMFANVGQHPAGPSETAERVITSSTSIPAGDVLTIADLDGPGLIRQLSVRMDSATDDELAGLHLVVTYDAETTPAINIPVARFFGAGNLRAPYRSLPLGSDSDDGFYSYWPMPFRQSVAVALHNTTASPILIDAALVEYEPGSFDDEMCQLRVHTHTNVKAPGQIYHPILSVAGRGHYVGTLLYIEQDSHSFSFLEGDDVITVDGAYTLYGTGLEDAFNGGYYYNWVAVQDDEPEGPKPQAATRPLNGILYVHREDGVAHARADQYRWHIADRIPFSTSIDVQIENRYAITDAVWSSVAFYYLHPGIPGDLNGDGCVDHADLGILLSDWGCTGGECPGDCDNDGDTDHADLGIMLAHWGDGC